MTEKRFTHKKWYNERQLFDGDEPFAIVDVYIQAEKICNKLNELHEEKEQLEKENKELKEKNKLIFEQIKAFRDDCITYSDFDGASTLNRLSDILKSSMEIWK